MAAKSSWFCPEPFHETYLHLSYPRVISRVVLPVPFVTWLGCRLFPLRVIRIRFELHSTPSTLILACRFSCWFVRCFKFRSFVIPIVILELHDKRRIFSFSIEAFPLRWSTPFLKLNKYPLVSTDHFLIDASSNPPHPSAGPLHCSAEEDPPLPTSLRSPPSLSPETFFFGGSH